MKNALVKTMEQWVWVEGYKGTDKDMKCRGYQYELGKQFDMPEDEKIEACESGFHLCTKLTDVHRYYDIGYGNRFFKVKALVRKKDLDKETENNGLYTMYGISIPPSFGSDSKLAARSIEFVEELTPDEILKGYITDEWSDEDKQDALRYGVGYVNKKHKALEEEKQKQTLVEFGYSDTFANWLISEGKYDVAFAVGSQPDLSMDMKVLVIMRDDD